MAKKLTQRDANGTLKVVGFNPLPELVRERARALRAVVGRAVDERRTSRASTTPAVGRTS